jgi:hypothetical protein
LGASAEDIRIKVDTASASAEIDRFLAETRAKSEVASEETGNKNGDLLAQGMRNSLMRNSPLIAAAVGAGLAFGAPRWSPVPVCCSAGSPRSRCTAMRN